VAKLTRKKKEPGSIRSRYAAVTISIFLHPEEKDQAGEEGEGDKGSNEAYRSIRTRVCVRLNATV